MIDDELDYQIRDILSDEKNNDNSSIVFKQAQDHYKACMDLDTIEKSGVQPFLDLLKVFGGWPVIDDKWDESKFDWLV